MKEKNPLVLKDLDIILSEIQPGVLRMIPQFLTPLLDGGSLEIRPGYWGAVEVHGIKGWVYQNMLLPKMLQPVEHYFMFAEYRRDIDDWVVLESTLRKGTGFALLRRDYLDRGATVRVYRHADPEAWGYGEEAVSKFYQKGRSWYGYFDIARIVAFCLTHLPPWELANMAYHDDHIPICTEAVNFSWAGVKEEFRIVRPKGRLPCPWTFYIEQMVGRIEFLYRLKKTPGKILNVKVTDMRGNWRKLER